MTFEIYSAKPFVPVYVLDEFVSMIWVDRYYKCGSFELTAYVSEELLKYCVVGNYISNSESMHFMIIEDIAIESNLEDGNKLKVVGRSVESILDRRIILMKRTISKNKTICYTINKLLQDNVTKNSNNVNGIYYKRKIPYFNIHIDVDHVELSDQGYMSENIDRNSTTVPTVGSKLEYDKENLLETIENLCETHRIGYRIYTSRLGTDGIQFDFELYVGRDRSFDQTERSQVIFSPSMDNLLESNFKHTTSSHKNNAIVYYKSIVTDESTGKEKDKSITVYVGDSDKIGLDRREVLIQPSVQKEKDEDGEEMTDEEFRKLLKTQGLEELDQYKVKKEFDCKCDTGDGSQFAYGRDYFMGDVIQVRNEYGIEEKAMITEFTWSVDSEGVSHYPTFTVLEETLADEQEDD